MGNIKYVVEPTVEGREALLAKIKKGTLASRASCKARILLKADKGPHGETGLGIVGAKIAVAGGT